MTLLDVSVTNVALPSISGSTGAGPSTLQWIVSGYTLAFGLVPVLAGRLGDDHGRRLMFIVGVGGFVVTSALSGLSTGGSMLITARVLQGVFGGLINPQVSGLVQHMFRGQERGRAFGMIGTVVGVGTALGPVVGGGLIALGGPDFGWRLVFFINVPFGLAVIALARRWLPDDRAFGKHRLDLLGAGVLGMSTFCVLFAAVEYDALHDDRLALLFIPAAVFGWMFYRREARLTRLAADPLIDLRLFRTPSYTSGVLLAVFFFAAMAGLPLVLALYYQQGLGYTALESGLSVTAYAIGSAIAASAAGRVVTRIGRPLVVGGCLLFALGSLAVEMSVRHAGSSDAGLILAAPLFFTGLGSGAVLTPNQTLSLMEVDPVVGSTAGGVLQTSQRIGLAIGQSVVGAAYFAALPATAGHLSGAARWSSYGNAIGTAAIVILCFVGAAIVVGGIDLLAGRHRRPAAQAATVAEAREPH